MFYSLCLCFLAYDIMRHNYPNSLSLEVLGFTHRELTWGSRSVSLTGLFWVFFWNLATLNSPSWPMLWVDAKLSHVRWGLSVKLSCTLERSRQMFSQSSNFPEAFLADVRLFFFSPPSLQKINTSGLGCLHPRGHLSHLCTTCKQAASGVIVTGMNTEAEKHRKSCCVLFTSFLLWAHTVAARNVHRWDVLWIFLFFFFLNSSWFRNHRMGGYAICTECTPTLLYHSHPANNDSCSPLDSLLPCVSLAQRKASGHASLAHLHFVSSHSVCLSSLSSLTDRVWSRCPPPPEPYLEVCKPETWTPWQHRSSLLSPKACSGLPQRHPLGSIFPPTHADGS